jgi:hypothetical protein
MTDLTDRMRTCAAFLVSRPRRNSGQAWVDAFSGIEDALNDAAALLIEASNLLEQPIGQIEAHNALEQLGAPMPTIPPGNQMAADRIQPLPYHEGLAIAKERLNPRACPKCESRGAKTVRVRRQGNQLMLQCPVCGEQWQWVRP